MPRPSSHCSCSGSRDGIALVMVLAFVVLLTILIISFISYTRLNRLATTSYSKSIQAQEVAQGGLQDILSDLHSEIVAGSMADPTGSTYTQGGTTIYVPWTNLTAIPARIGYAATSYGTDTTATTLPPTLIRVSRATGTVANGDNFYSHFSTSAYTNNIAAVPGDAIPNRASQASTGISSANGRSISATRWNKTYLLAPYTANIPTPFTGNPPEWVYVTRTGSRVCATSELTNLEPSGNLTQNYGPVTPGSNPPASPVVGRYAFVMYDEGALLDVDAAGYVSGATNAGIVPPTANNPASIGQGVSTKSYLAYADLTKLPGLNAANGQTQIDSLVSWRNASANLAGPATKTAGVNYLNAVFSYAQNGFLDFLNNGTGLVDSPLMGRQDLINYFANIDSKINTTSAAYSQALPYLGTFDRAVNAPSYGPPADASTLGGNNNVVKDNGTAASPGTKYFAYKTNAESTRPDGTPNPNRDIPNIRIPTTIAANTAITHYNDDTTTTNYTVNPGDPLVQRRFSLARINWLSHTGPNGSYTNAAAAIQACFGLAWDSGNHCWNYVQPAPSGTTAPYIETLAEVAAENPPREPNFFELLKAGILNGSLGQEPGQGGADPANKAAATYGLYSTGPGDADYSINGVAGLYFDICSASADPQIMQIGANVVDQYDTDSYPTAIYFPKLTGSSLATADTAAELRLANTVFGQENLPYLTRILQIETGNLATDNQSVNGYYQPELWNPYQATATAPSASPTQFRIQAYGQVLNSLTPNPTLSTLYYVSDISPPSPSPVVDYTNNLYNGASPQAYDGTSTNVNYIYFNDNPGLTSSNFYKSPHFLLKADPGVGSTSPIDLWTANNCSDSFNQFAAFFAGAVPDLVGWIPPPPGSYGKLGGGTYPLGGYSTFNGTVELGSGGYYMTLVTEYNDGTNWLPYGLFSRLSVRWYEGIGSKTPATLGDTSTWDTNSNSEGWIIERPDPRTDRFSASAVTGGFARANTTLRSDPVSAISIGNYGVIGDFFPQNQAFTLIGSGIQRNKAPTFPGGDIGLALFLQNETTDPSFAPGALYAPINSYYADADGVVRPGDGYAADGNYNSINGTGTTGDGQELFNDTDPTMASIMPNTANVRRPVILNHAFRTVGDLGFAYRDDPFRTLDFWTPLSADSALMDLFSITDQPAVIAGQLSPSNSPAPVLNAVISGGTQNSDLIAADPGMTTLSSTDSTAISKAIATQLLTSPLRNRADLASLGPVIQTYANTGYPNSYIAAYLKNKANGEAPIRALSSVTNTRTWNLLIDIIAQSGHLIPNAAKLTDFVVEGERRYWLHIAIDRYSGKIVDQQLEPVYE